MLEQKLPKLLLSNAEMINYKKRGRYGLRHPKYWSKPLERILLVQSLRKNLHQIEAEISRWRDVLGVPYRAYLLAK